MKIEQTLPTTLHGFIVYARDEDDTRKVEVLASGDGAICQRWITKIEQVLYTADKTSARSNASDLQTFQRRWVFRPQNALPLELRKDPDLDGSFSGFALAPGDTFCVSEEKADGNILYLK